MISRLRLNIKHLLVLLFGGITVLAGLPTYLYVDHIYAKQLIEDRGDSLHSLAKASASVLSTNLHERQREIYLMAKSTLFRSADLNDSELQAVLDRAQASFPHYSWLGMADTDGMVRAATGGILVGQSVRARPWFAQGLKQPYSGDLHQALLLSKLLKQPYGSALQLIDFSEPIEDAQGHVRGVLGAHVNWNWAADVLHAMQPANASLSQVEILIVNRDHAIIHPQKYGATNVPSTIRENTAFSVDEWGDGVRYVSSIVPVHESATERAMGWRILVRQPVTQAYSDLSSIQRVLLVTLLISGLIFLALVWWGALLISRPLKELAEHARSIEQGEETTPLTVPSHAREIHELVQALQGMASTLLQRKSALEQSNLVLEKTVAERTAELQQSNDDLLRISRHDALTGIFNRLAASERLHAEFARMKRTQVCYAVLMLDIDFFKKVNDNLGHEAGDSVLQSVALALQSKLRETDFLARFGGEEFLVLLPGTELAAASEVAEKLREAVALAPNATQQPVTISIGLAMAGPDDSNEDDAVRQADSFLYQAKHAGRNRVVSRSLD